MTTHKTRRLLIIGATGQVGGDVVRTLAKQADIETLAAVRRVDQAEDMRTLGAEPIHLDLDDMETVEKAVQGVDGLLLMAGYSVDMLKQSKRVIDAAKRAGVDHIVHIGTSGADTAEVAHWGWHRMIEAYVEDQGFRFTHIRPEGFMQNVLTFGWLQRGALTNLIGDARWSWVDARDVAALAAAALADPDTFGGQVWRLGYDAGTIADVAGKISDYVGHSIEIAPLDPQVFYDGAVGAGADPAYMACIRDQFRLNAEGAIPNADETFDAAAFERTVGRPPASWADYIARDGAALTTAAAQE
ncbi:MAG: NmrA family NAD(P)-binding protein [Pseudomonadota bacterium]